MAAEARRRWLSTSPCEYPMRGLRVGEIGEGCGGFLGTTSVDLYT